MAEPERKFQIVEDPPSQEASAGRLSDLGAQALYLGLQTLGKRTLVAIDNLFCLLTVFSVFWLALSISHPDAYQLTEMGGYALFVLAANVIARRK